MPETEDVVPIADDACDFAGVLAPRDSVVWSPVPDVQKRVLDPFWSRYYAIIVMCVTVVATTSYYLSPFEGAAKCTHGLIGGLVCIHANCKVLKYETANFNLLLRLSTTFIVFIWMVYSVLGLYFYLFA